MKQTYEALRAKLAAGELRSLDLCHVPLGALVFPSEPCIRDNRTGGYGAIDGHTRNERGIDNDDFFPAIMLAYDNTFNECLVLTCKGRHEIIHGNALVTIFKSM